jgi:3'-phosphoadenosine 5'-phosphosulfate sulfotransferase (PAPS reductase)/FAD synthetase
MCQTATPGDERARPAARAIKVNLKAYDWIVVNSSAGKDSQAMLDVVVERARADGVLDRVVVVHCDLGRVEWPGTPELAERQARHYGVRFEKISRPQGDLLIQVEQRAATIARKGKAASPFPSPTNRYCTAHQKTDQANKVINKLVREKAASPWPSSTNRWCTSDQKRGQVSVVINRLAKERRKKGRRVRVLNCLGMRAAESPARSKLLPFRLDRRQTNGRKVVHTWLPLFAWTVDDVWARIRASGVEHHYAYDLGMPRLSCCFCIFAPRSALMLSGRHNPELLDEYVRLELKVGSKFKADLSLKEIQDAIRRGDDPGEVRTWEM